MTKPYRLHSLARIIAYKVYINFLSDQDDDKLSPSEIKNLFTTNVSRNLVTSALEWLRDAKMVSRHTDRATGGHKYKLTEEGILLVERALRKRDSDLVYFAKNGDAALDEIAGLDSIWITPDERADSDQWSPLAIDRGDPEFVATLEAVEAALEAIRGDNGYAANEPDERAGIVATLEEGVQWLKERAPTKAQVQNLVIAPLRWIAAKFAQGVTGQAANAAAQKLWKWLSDFW